MNLKFDKTTGLFLLLCVILLVLTLSCKKDSNSNNAIIGKWRFVGSYQSTGGPETFSPAANNQANDYVRFGSGGKIESDYFLGTASYSLSGTNGLTINFVNPVNTGQYIFSINSDTFKIGSNGCIEGCDVVFVRE